MSNDTLEKFNPKNKSSFPSAKETAEFNDTIKASRYTKKAIDRSGISKKKKDILDNLSYLELVSRGLDGMYGSKRIQAEIKRENAQSEKIIGRGVDNNAFIVIGNDRVSKLHTGYGGKGHTQCDSIDIVAGMASFQAKEVEIYPSADTPFAPPNIEVPIKTNPNFFLDAARIYISQKTDVDKNFRLAEFGLSEKNKKDDKDDNNIGKYGAKSAIALKADNLRFISRETTKIVTGTDQINSQGGLVQGKHGIELIAMNDSLSLQPMVLGDNLLELLITVVENLEKMASYLNAASTYQMKFNKAVTEHTHICQMPPKPTKKSRSLKTQGMITDMEKIQKTDLSTIKTLTNFGGLISNYLSPTGQSTKQQDAARKSFILSELNKCN